MGSQMEESERSEYGGEELVGLDVIDSKARRVGYVKDVAFDFSKGGITVVIAKKVPKGGASIPDVEKIRQDLFKEYSLYYWPKERVEKMLRKEIAKRVGVTVEEALSDDNLLKFAQETEREIPTIMGESDVEVDLGSVSKDDIEAVGDVLLLKKPFGELKTED